jgi:CRISPR-associated protein Cmr2
MLEECRDLVVVSLPGVQRIIGEARSTADLWAGSEIVGRLARRAAVVAVANDAELVIPHAVDAGVVPNRVVLLGPLGSGPLIGRRAADAARECWGQLYGRVFPDGGAACSPGFPLVQWVSVPGDVSYAERWSRGQRLLVARRRVHDFAPVAMRGRQLCSLSPRWAAVPPPVGLAEHEKDVLSAVNWVKRRLPRSEEDGGFPSTASIASAPYRARLAATLPPAAAALRKAALDLGLRGESPVLGLPEAGDAEQRWWLRSAGPWIYPGMWNVAALSRELGRDGREIAAAVAAGDAAAKELPGEPGDHLAVLAQDLDDMGRYLSGVSEGADGQRLVVTAEGHRAVAERLAAVAATQRGVLREPGVLGVPIYLGGDDLLALVPAATALEAARRCRDALRGTTLPTASTAVLFFHRRSGLQGAIAGARSLLELAKGSVPGKDGLAIGYLRRSGSTEMSVQPWAVDPVGALQIFTRDADHVLSPRLVADLVADADGLAELDTMPGVQRAELRRLVGRHLDRGVPPQRVLEVADALALLGQEERAPDAPGRCVPGARVGVFLRQEAR